MSADILPFPPRTSHPVEPLDPVEAAFDTVVHDTYMRMSDDAVNLLRTHFAEAFENLSEDGQVAAAAHLAERVLTRSAELMHITAEYRERLVRSKK